MKDRFILGMTESVLLLTDARDRLLKLQAECDADATSEYLKYEIEDLDRLIAKFRHMILISKEAWNE